MSEATIDSNSPGSREQGLSILSDLLGGDTNDVNVRRSSVKMLRASHATDSLVFTNRSIGTIDNHGLAEMVADLLKNRYEFRGNEDRVRAVASSKLLDFEVGRQLLAPIPSF